MKITKYNISTEKKGIDLKIAVVSDLHARPYKKTVEALKSINPDIILLPGDIVEIAADYMDKRNQNGLGFLKEAASIAPTYYCHGNHEIYYSHAKFGHRKTPEQSLNEKYAKTIESFGINTVNDSCLKLDTPDRGEASDVYIGGLVCGRDKDPALNEPMPNLEFLSEYDSISALKILLCHYPHYYDQLLKDKSFDLILSGHAHGGQWRIFGRGVFAPHQGIFPKFTSGIYDNKHIISRGAANNVKPIPRFFNPCEVLEIHVTSKNQ